MDKGNVFGIVFLVFIGIFVSTQFFSVTSNTGNSGSMFSFSVFENEDRGNCTMTRYNNCEYINYEYGKSESSTKIGFNNNKNDLNLYDNDYTNIDYNCVGDSATFIFSDKKDIQISCTESGCEGEPIDLEGNLKISRNEVLVSANNEGNVYLYIICFDYDKYFNEKTKGDIITTTEDWSWVYQFRYFTINKNDFSSSNTIINEPIVNDIIINETIIDNIKKPLPVVEKSTFFENVKDFVVNLLNKIKEGFN